MRTHKGKAARGRWLPAAWFFCGLLLAGLLTAGVLASPQSVVAAPMLQVEPTPDPCGPPTLTPAGTVVNLRSGPGAEYAIVRTAGADELFPIIGRAETRRYWVVALPDGEQGWVFADIVTVAGDISGVPIVEPPLVDGEPLPPGTAWTPPITVICSDLPDPTPAPLPAPAAVLTASLAAEEGTAWNPINLSRSGQASAPLLVEAAGELHVFWKEADIEQFVYVVGSVEPATGEVVASVAIPVELPFGTRRLAIDLPDTEPTPLYDPILLYTPADRLHAIWIDDNQQLWASSVSPAAVADYAAWSEPLLLGQAAAVSAAVTDDGALHVAFVQPRDTVAEPAGAYYRRSVDDGAAWSPAELLFASRYFRSVGAADAHVSLAADSQGRLVVGWDLRRLEQVYAAVTVDGGMNWSEPLLVDRRAATDHPNAPGPRRIMAVGTTTQLHLFWQAGRGPFRCTQLHSWLDTGETTWAPAAGVADVTGCPDDLAPLAEPAGGLLLVAAAPGTPLVAGWDGTRWSLALAELLPADYQHPETERRFTLNCRTYRRLPADRLLLLGCDDRGDVWLTGGDLRVEPNWFPEDSPWQTGPALTVTGAQIGAARLLQDAAGRRHLFWYDAAAADVGYVRLDGDGWSRPQLLAAGEAFSGPAVPPPAGDRLLAGWLNQDRTQFVVTAAGADQAASADGWAAAQTAFFPPTPVTDVALQRLGDGTLWATFTVPINESRGIYAAAVDEAAGSWSAPMMLFDGAAAGWDVVGRARMAGAGAAARHLLWSRPDLTGAESSLVYARQVVDGSWSAPETVAGGSLLWYELLVSGTQQVHRLWQIDAGGWIELWHQTSADGGRTWQVPLLVDSREQTPFAVDVAADAAGALHLFSGRARGFDHLIWDGERWSLDSETWSAPSGAPDHLLAAVGPDGFAGTVFTILVDEAALIFQVFELPDFQANVVDDGLTAPPETTPGPAADAPTADVETALPAEATPTPVVDLSGDGARPGGQLQNYALGLLPALLFLGFVFLLVGRRVVRHG